MKTYDRTKPYRRDNMGRDGRQQVMPWAPGLTCSVNEAAKRLGVSYETARSIILRGEIQSWPISEGVKWSPRRVSIDSVQLYLERKLYNNAIDDKELERRLDKRIAGLSATANSPNTPAARSPKDLR